MLLTVNGRPETAPHGLALFSYIRSKGLAPDLYVFMLNDRVLDKDELDSVILQENDQLEVLRFVGGG